MPGANPSICFVSPNGFAALAGIRKGHIGGAERYLSVMARWLAGRGYRVSMVTWGDGQPEGASIDGVRLVKMCRRDAGIRGLRFLHPRWSSLAMALGRADANVYYYACGDLGLGQIALWCRRTRRKCIYGVMADPECDPRLPLLRSFRERLLYRLGLRWADVVITQTRRQQEMMRDGFGISSILSPMPCEGVAGEHEVPVDRLQPKPPRVLWVGRISEEKRLEWLLEIAQRCPELSFDVVGSSNEQSRYAATVLRDAARIPNVLIHGRVPHSDLSEFYRCALCLCSTSIFEGFPNTFLEAWSCALPVVSTLDPDGLIARRGLGWVAQDVDGLAAHISRLAESPKVRGSVSAAARRYYLENHALEVTMPRFERVLLDTACPS